MLQRETYSFFNHFVRGAAHYTVGGSVSKILVAINVIVILAVMAPYQYGVYKLAFSVYLVVNGLLLSGINGLVLNDVVQYRKDGMLEKAKRLMYEFFTVRITLGTISFLIIYLGSNIIAVHYSEGIALYLKIFSFLFITDALITVTDTFLKSKLDFLGSNVIPFVSELVKFVLLAYFSFVSADGLSIARLSIATVAGSAAGLLGIVVYIKLRHRVTLSLPMYETSPLLHIIKTYGKWGIAKNYVSTFVDNVRLWLVKLFISTEAVAIFSVAMSLASTIKKAIPTQSLTSLIPLHIKQPEVLKDIYERVTKYAIWIYAVAIIGGFIFIPLILPFVFPKYISAIPYFKVFIWAAIFKAMVLNKQVIYSLRRQSFLFSLPVIELVSTVTFGVLLIPTFGLYGTATEYFITEALIFWVMYAYLIRIQPQLRFHWARLFSFDSHDRTLIREVWLKVKNRFI